MTSCGAVAARHSRSESRFSSISVRSTLVATVRISGVGIGRLLSPPVTYLPPSLLSASLSVERRMRRTIPGSSAWSDPTWPFRPRFLVGVGIQNMADSSLRCGKRTRVWLIPCKPQDMVDAPLSRIPVAPLCEVMPNKPELVSKVIRILGKPLFR